MNEQTFALITSNYTQYVIKRIESKIQHSIPSIQQGSTPYQLPITTAYET